MDFWVQKTYMDCQIVQSGLFFSSISHVKNICNDGPGPYIS